MSVDSEILHVDTEILHKEAALRPACCIWARLQLWGRPFWAAAGLSPAFARRPDLSNTLANFWKGLLCQRAPRIGDTHHAGIEHRHILHQAFHVHTILKHNLMLDPVRKRQASKKHALLQD
jgi:hypothetical protein